MYQYQNCFYSRDRLIDCKDALPGDIVYEYGTNKKYEVIKNQLVTGELHEVTLNDKRSICFIKDEEITISEKSDIKLYPFNPKDDYIETPLYPDPYTMGAFLIYGDYMDEYINLPLGSINNGFILNKYHFKIADKLGNDKIYFRLDGNDGKDCITWKEFMGRYKCLVNTFSIHAPLIPTEYRYTSLKNRIKFISGVFDCGYNITQFPDTVSISHSNDKRLEEVRLILWSMGISSKISYDPNIPGTKNEYRLDVIKEYEGYPGLFYNYYNIENMLYCDNIMRRPINDDILKIESIKYLGMGCYYNIITNKPNMVYYSNNYLPKVSL